MTASAISELLERAYPGRRAALKRDILSQALLCFNQRGVEATTIDVVKAAVGTSVGAIYHHFGNKEGLITALYLTALNDQAQLREQALAHAQTIEQVVNALVTSYVDWVASQPQWAKFLFDTRQQHKPEALVKTLQSRNSARNAQLFDKVKSMDGAALLQPWSPDLLPALIVGPAEHYCRAWLAGRVTLSPQRARDQLAQAAWLCLRGAI